MSGDLSYVDPSMADTNTTGLVLRKYSDKVLSNLKTHTYRKYRCTKSVSSRTLGCETELEELTFKKNSLHVCLFTRTYLPVCPLYITNISMYYAFFGKLHQINHRCRPIFTDGKRRETKRTKSENHRRN